MADRIARSCFTLEKGTYILTASNYFLVFKVLLGYLKLIKLVFLLYQALIKQLTFYVLTD